MKKDFLDYLYELRASVQSDIDRLTNKQKEPQTKCCKNFEYCNETSVQIEAKRIHLMTVNQTIEKYLLLHK